MANKLVEQKQASSHIGSVKLFFVPYSNKPFIYLGLAAIFQLYRRRLKFLDICVHMTVFTLINQYDLNQTLQEQP